MAPQRPTRKSARRSSPMDRTPEAQTDPDAQQLDARKQSRLSLKNGTWLEPELAPSQPSFMEYKGLERQGVLENMAPLGEAPSTKLKAKIRAEGNRGAPRANNRAKRIVKEAAGISPDVTTPVTRSRRSQTVKGESTRPATPQQTVAAPDTATPSRMSTRSSTHAAPTRESRQPTTELPTSVPKNRKIRKLQDIVTYALGESHHQNHLHLGNAIHRLFSDSSKNRSLSILLNIMIRGKGSNDEITRFNQFILTAKRQSHRAAQMRRKLDKLSDPEAKGLKADQFQDTLGGRLSSTGAHPRVAALEDGEVSTPTPITTIKREAAVIGEPEINGRPSKRQKPSGDHSRSASSTSTLSSALSLEDVATGVSDAHATQFLEDVQDVPEAATLLNSKQPKSTLATSTNSRKRKSEVDHEEVDEAAIAAKRQRLTKRFDDVKVQSSNVRGRPRKNAGANTNANGDRFSTPTRTRSTRRRRDTAGQLRDQIEDDENGYGDDENDNDAAAVEAQGNATQSPRLGTPMSIGQSTKKTKTARIKMSPVKKKSGVTAGIVRQNGKQISPVGKALKGKDEDDNNDFCSACGGSGGLVCCDGCSRSFHFTCSDPPMDPDNLPETWYCYVCMSKKVPAKRYRGPFGPLLTHLDGQNPVAYHLPEEIRDYFEGVKTGEEGEYEEVVAQPKTRNRTGYDETPDLLKLKDGKNNVVLCYYCKGSAVDHREIVACDYCNLQWHLDCTSPPMAIPPRRGTNGKGRHYWMCPNHADHELRALDPSVKQEARGERSFVSGPYRVRRPKNANIVEPAISRGMINNGDIEIDNDPSDAEGDNFYDKQEFGVVYRLPERSIKLDFIDKIKRARERSLEKRTQEVASMEPQLTYPTVKEEERPEEHRRQLESLSQIVEELHKRSFVDQQAAINLVHFSISNKDLDLGTGQIDDLIKALMNEAPSEIVGSLNDKVIKESTIPPSPPSSDSRPDQSEGALPSEERKSLLLLQELIRRRLGSAPVMA